MARNIALARAQAKSEIIRGQVGDLQLIKDDTISVKPVPVELKWNMSDKEFEHYTKISADIMRYNNEFRDEFLRRMLKLNNVLIYPLEQVVDFVSRITSGRNCHFMYLSRSYNKGNIKRDNIGKAIFDDRYFGGFVPLRVVERVNLISRIRFELNFIVSSNENVSEKFVGAYFNEDSTLFIIDMWDEKESVIKEGK